MSAGVTVKPNRFLLFYSFNYYPSGGWNDLIDSFDDKATALYFSSQLDEGNADTGSSQVIDLETGEEVKE